MPEKQQERTDAIFHALLEKTAQRMKEEAIPAGQPGGPAIFPDPSDLTPTGPSTGPIPPPQGPSVPGRPGQFPGGNPGGRPALPPDGGLGGFHGGIPGPYVVPVLPTVSDRASRTKVGKRSRLLDPDDCSTFDEQVRVIAENIRTYVLSGRADRAVAFVSEWCDGVVDEDGTVFPEVHEALSGMGKASLVAFVEALIRFVEKNTD